MNAINDTGAARPPLPMNPFLFLGLYWLIYILYTIAIAAFDEPFSSLAGAITLVLMMWVHLYWIYAALRYVSAFAPMAGRRLEIAAYIYKFVPLVVLGLIVYDKWVAPLVGSPVIFEIMAVLFGFSIAASGIWLVMKAASTLCTAEEQDHELKRALIGKEKISTGRRVGTFLLFVYVVLCAPFIFRRLVKLAPAS